MNTQEEILQLHDELRKLQEQAKKSRYKKITGLGLLLIVILLLTAYGSVQRVEARKNADEANMQHELADRSAYEATSNAAEAQKQTAIANALSDELKECRGSRK